MAKLHMKQIWICALNKDIKDVTDVLQMSGVVDITTVDSEKNNILDSRMNSEEISCERNLKLCDDALEILDKYYKEKTSILSSFEGPKNINLSDAKVKIAKSEQTLTTVNQIIDTSKNIQEAKMQIIKCENKIEQLKAWENLDVNLNFKGTEKVRTFIGAFKNEQTYDNIYQGVCDGLDEEIAKYVDVSIINATKEMTTVMVITLTEYAEKVEAQLKKMEFSNSPFAKSIPREEINNIKNEIEEYNANIKNYEQQIVDLAKERDEIKFTRDYYAILKDKYNEEEKMVVTKNTSILTGYIPENYVKGLEEKLSKNEDVYVEITEPDENVEVPVALKNGFYADPMETVVESYSMPNKDEIDPSKVLSIFYYVLFGLMLSDAGYGLLLFLGTGLVLLKVKNLKPEMKKMMKLFFYGGIFTIFWGILFGSFFGNAVDVIAQYIRGTETVEPVFVPFLKNIHIYWFNPVEEPMRLLVFAFVIGLVHLFTGLFIKGYMLLKQNAIKDFVYDVVFWIMFVGGGVAYLLTMEMVTGMIGMDKPLGAPLPTIAGIIMGIGCVGVVLTSGRESKNWFKRLLKGAYGAYGITGWLSDVLSYSRLLALGLATGIIAEVFNTMGSMVKVPVLGLIIFIIVFVVGHILNLGINVLGAYVHTNRLQFVEFFGKFYSGGGTKYTPFTENTKYYIIKED